LPYDGIDALRRRFLGILFNQILDGCGPFLPIIVIMLFWCLVLDRTDAMHSPSVCGFYT